MYKAFKIKGKNTLEIVPALDTMLDPLILTMSNTSYTTTKHPLLFINFLPGATVGIRFLFT